MSTAGETSELAQWLSQRKASPKCSVVMTPKLLQEAAALNGKPAALFGSRDACDGFIVLHARALQPECGLVRIGAVESTGADVPAGDVRLTPSEPPRAAVDGMSVPVIVRDPSLYRDRVASLPGVDALDGKTALVVGLGSIGSDLGASLVRLGATVIGCDADVLVVQNLVRWGLPVSIGRAIGRPKSSVWAESLRATVPDARVEGHAIDVVEQGAELAAIIRRARPQLLIAATDTRDSRRVVNAAAAEHGIPALFVALSDGASSVRIEVVEDARRGPCHLCAAVAEGNTAVLANNRASRMPYAAEAAPAATAVPALPVDIALGTAVATRVSLLMLAGQNWKEYFRRGEQQGNVLFLSLKPNWWIFDEAWDRMVYQVQQNPECPACGAAEAARGA